MSEKLLIVIEYEYFSEAYLLRKAQSFRESWGISAEMQVDLRYPAVFAGLRNRHAATQKPQTPHGAGRVSGVECGPLYTVEWTRSLIGIALLNGFLLLIFNEIVMIMIKKLICRLCRRVTTQCLHFCGFK